MNIDDYQIQAGTTAIYRDKIKTYLDDLFSKHTVENAKEELVGLLSIAYTVLGLAGEAGEIANKVKKVIRDGGGKVTKEFIEDMKSESGDLEWYNANFSAELGTDMSFVLEHNLEKLFGRKERGTLTGSGDKR